MQKVIGINLNGNAYQIEESGYDALVAYLERAQTALVDNPDKAEIVADLEQAIAEKCQRFLAAHKTVVASAEIDQIIEEMGPVDAGTAEAGGAAKPDEKAADDTPKKDERAPKRLYQIREGAMLSGVCNGLAAYLDVDVTLVRIAFVILAVLTKGVFLLVYGALMFVTPYATTSEEHAAAHGRPSTAKELVDQAKRNYTEFTTSKEWKRHWRKQRRQWNRIARREQVERRVGYIRQQGFAAVRDQRHQRSHVFHRLASIVARFQEAPTARHRGFKASHRADGEWGGRSRRQTPSCGTRSRKRRCCELMSSRCESGKRKPCGGCVCISSSS